MELKILLHFIDIIGTFVFALSGTAAGIRRGFDVFGIFVLAMITACGGGVLRDVCIGSIPPAGLVTHDYLIAVIVAVLIGFFFHRAIVKMEKPTLWLDAVGLGFFAAFGAEKTYHFTQNIQLSIILGCVTAVGGGCMRDVLAARSPVIFSREIYASAAIVGAGVALLGPTGIINQQYSIWLAIGSCMAIRLISMHYKINLPSLRKKKTRP